MDDLDAAIALIYAQPPSGFVAARAALVKELKAAKRKDDAGRVAALRRPTKLAWALGEALRRAPEQADAYFAAIAALAEPGGDLRRRTADLRSAVAALVGGAEGVDPGEATASLLATAADPEATTALRLGRLAEVPVAGGFGLAAAGGLAPAAGEATTPDGRREEEEPGRADGAPAGRAEAGPSAAEDEEAARDEAAAERERREDEEQARAERLAGLEAERAEAEAAEAAAAERVAAAEAAAEAAQAELATARSLLDAARQATVAAAEGLRQTESRP